MTRRVIKLKYDNTHHEMKTDKYGTRVIEIQDDVEGETLGRNDDGSTWRKIRGYIEPKPPCKKGDILYVRETWCDDRQFTHDDTPGIYFYKASECDDFTPKWKPSIHMPKEAARIFLKVTNVRVERLQCMSWDDICNEGVIPDSYVRDKFSFEVLQNKFKNLFNSTIKKSDLVSMDVMQIRGCG